MMNGRISLGAERELSYTQSEVKVLTDYSGRDIRLTDERLGHILDHPEMRGLEAFLEDALRRPEIVMESVADPEARLFYRQLEETRVGVKWLCVVVKYRGNDAFVLTAYLTDRPKKGKQLWPAR
jgi:hypothetical protein